MAHLSASMFVIGPQPHHLRQPALLFETMLERTCGNSPPPLKQEVQLPVKRWPNTWTKRFLSWLRGRSWGGGGLQSMARDEPWTCGSFIGLWILRDKLRNTLMAAEKSYSRVEVGANISRARNSSPQIHVSLVAAYIIYCTSLERQVSRRD